nr:cytochrome P450 2F3-like [Rhipicephalus microplus]
MVIVNDFEAIEKLFSKDELLCRSKEWRLYGLSVGYPMSLEGDEWVENRRFCLQALRDIGFARPSVQNDILDECHRLIECIAESDGQPIAIEDLILPSVSNNAVAPVFGESYPFDHPKRKWLDDTLRKLAVAVNTTRRITPLGFLKGPFLNTLAFPGRRDIEKHFRALGDFTRTEIDARRRSVKLPSSKTLIDAYLTKMAQHENDPQSKMSVENLMSTAIGFFQAGSAGVPTYMNWHMINFALRADTLQAQVQAEIDRVVGSLRRPTWEDRTRMPLTMDCRVGDAALEGHHPA